MISRILKPIELSHDWVLKNFKYQDPEFYNRSFDQSEEGPSEVTPGCKDVVVIRKLVPGTPKFYVFK